MLKKFFGYIKNLNYLNYPPIKDTIITILETFCLLLLSVLSIAAIFFKKITLNTLVEKIEQALTPEDLNLMPEKAIPLKQLKQEVLDYLEAGQVLISTPTPTMLALLVLLILT